MKLIHVFTKYLLGNAFIVHVPLLETRQLIRSVIYKYSGGILLSKDAFNVIVFCFKATLPKSEKLVEIINFLF